MNIKHMMAYGDGVLDGYKSGTYDNPYDPEQEPENHQAYGLGYEHGVAVYCQEIDGDEA